VLLEERELAERFGAEYLDYCRRVPRYVPRRRTDPGR
jgi:protein-S-isoprenylcysteine O-methyltransferase Ste14